MLPSKGVLLPQRMDTVEAIVPAAIWPQTSHTWTPASTWPRARHNGRFSPTPTQIQAFLARSTWLRGFGSTARRTHAWPASISARIAAILPRMRRILGSVAGTGIFKWSCRPCTVFRCCGPVWGRNLVGCVSRRLVRSRHWSSVDGGTDGIHWAPRRTMEN